MTKDELLCNLNANLNSSNRAFSAIDVLFILMMNYCHLTSFYVTYNFTKAELMGTITIKVLIKNHTHMFYIYKKTHEWEMNKVNVSHDVVNID